MNCKYCGVPYTVGIFGSFFHSCKQEDLDPEQKNWQSGAIIQIGEEIFSSQEIVEMVQWVKREMKK